jgi:predicted flap endonuclease-1-like 5' DNA nuclease
MVWGYRMDRSIKSLFSIILIVAAVFVAMNRVVENARLEDWWLVVVLAGLAVLIYVSDSLGRGSTGTTDTRVEAGHSSLDGFRQVVAPVAPAAVITPKVMTEAESDHAEIVKAYGEIRDTDARSDGMASSSTTDTQEARAIEGMVQNVSGFGAMGTYEEVDEIAGGPVGSMSNEQAKAAPATPPVPTPVVQVMTSDPVPEVPQTAEASSRSTYNDTEARSDIMASVATMDTPEAQETETGIVENIMETGATGIPEEVDEIAGGPAPSMSVDQANAVPASAQPDDLTVIEGIGMKMAAALKTAGIDTFARLSSTSEADIRAAIGAAGMRFAPSIPTWAHQASLAAKGDWSGLQEYQQTVKAGRKK